MEVQKKTESLEKKYIFFGESKSEQIISLSSI